MFSLQIMVRNPAPYHLIPSSSGGGGTCKHTGEALRLKRPEKSLLLPGGGANVSHAIVEWHTGMNFRNNPNIHEAVTIRTSTNQNTATRWFTPNSAVQPVS